MNKKALAIALSVISILVLAAGSIAYFTTTGKAKNTVSSSNVKIQLIALTEDENGNKSVADGKIAVAPGEWRSWIVQIKNTGKEEAWLRLRVNALANGGPIPVDENDEPALMLTELNEKDWTYSDGWLYYNKKLPAGETTEPVFEGAEFGPEIGNDLKGADFTLDVTAEATQTKNNGSRATEAAGWPES